MHDHALDLGLLLLRVATGVVIFMHGYNHFFGGGRLRGAGRWFDSLGIRPGYFHAWVTAVVEVGAGVLLIVGFLTPVAAAGVVGIVSVAGIVVHRKNGFFVLKEGWEYVTYLALVSAAIGVMGPGEWSLDHAIGWHDIHGGWGLALSFGLGFVAALGLLAVFWRPPKPA
ncbi:MAG TPA: DoxX family protein [Acidimicrobiales bacterium]